MGKKMKLPFLSKSSETTPSWPWPSCKNPKTLSFRSTEKTIDMSRCQGPISHDSHHFSSTCTKIDETVGKNECIWIEGEVEEETIGLRADDRLIFYPEETRSILEEAKNVNSRLRESEALEMDSQDPYIDFKNSMEEMVEAYGLSDWENLEELLNCYLKLNDKNTHGYVVGAFVDLLVGISFSSISLGCSNDNEYHGETTSSNSAHDSLFSPLSFSVSTISTSPCLSSLELVENDVEKEVDSGSSQML